LEHLLLARRRSGGRLLLAHLDLPPGVLGIRYDRSLPAGGRSSGRSGLLRIGCQDGGDGSEGQQCRTEEAFHDGSDRMKRVEKVIRQAE
jgi:hypothetical protein